MIHLANAAINFPTVVRTICLELAARGAIRWSTVFLTDEDIFGIKAFQPFRVQWKSLPASILIQSMLRVGLPSRLLLCITGFLHAALSSMPF
jgi:hypothetical protein